MSQVYSTEPNTTGRVIFDTSHGPIDINLWCKECPTSTRMFLQLCLDGFYDSIIFHRIMQNFLIQAGQVRFKDSAGRKGGASQDVPFDKDMKQYLRNHDAEGSGTTSASEAVYSGARQRKLEVSPRIRFNHRGQVALALPLEDDVEGNGAADALRAQFFITLDETPFLDGKHVIFGSVVGPTIFNALRIGKVDAEDETSRPVDMDVSPPVVKSVKIDYHPFKDLVPTDDAKIPWRNSNCDKGDSSLNTTTAEESVLKKRRKKRKGKRDLNVLSFGGEMEDGEDGGDPDGGGMGMRSSHDVVSRESSFLSSAVDDCVKEASVKIEENNAKERSRKRDDYGNNVTSLKDDETAQSMFTATLPSQNYSSEPRRGERKRAEKESSIFGTDDDKKADFQLPRAGANHKDKKKVSLVESRRAKYLRKGSSKTGDSKRDKLEREEDTIAKMVAFRSKIMKSKEKNSGLEGVQGHGGDRQNEEADHSLAARMARSAEDKRILSARVTELPPSYHGQILEEANDTGSSDSWLQTKFNCKYHINHKSAEIGKSGRNLDDYVVVGGSRSKRSDESGRADDWHKIQRRA